MQGVAEVIGRQLTLLHIVSVAFVDDDAIGHLHNAALDALQLVTRTSQLNKQEEVDHRMTSGLALSHAYGFNENFVVASSLT